MGPTQSSHPPWRSVHYVRHPAPRTCQTNPTRTSLQWSHDFERRPFCKEPLLVYLEGRSKKVGGPNKTAEIDESKFGRRKYHRGHRVKGQWVFGGVERESGRRFVVPVPGRTVDTQTIVICAWIEPGTTIISDCWAAYRDIESLGYENHSISFVNPVTGDNLTPASVPGFTLRVSSDLHHRREDYEYHPAQPCSRQNARHNECLMFTHLLGIAASIYWSSCALPAHAESSTTWLPVVRQRKTTASGSSGICARVVPASVIFDLLQTSRK